MKNNMERRKSDYRHINSYSDLCREKMHLSYRAQYSEKQLHIKLLELGYNLHPARLVPSLLSEWGRPMITELLNRIKGYFFGSSRKRHRKNPHPRND
ncbi:hypothetical protein ACT29H_05195 [Thermophagus sp. OGC60D27]|uniref:hypothetical protein n=1 Tax=Thermophagus sp. OGC60D27 TaxID=3458415 RepID=UPI0040383528